MIEKNMENIENKPPTIHNCYSFLSCIIAFGFIILGNYVNHEILTPLFAIIGVVIFICTMCSYVAKI